MANIIIIYMAAMCASVVYKQVWSS